MGGCRARGTFPFVASLDHLGPLARSARDLALAYDAMQGDDPADPAQIAGRRSSRDRPSSARASAGCASRSPAAISASAATPEALAAVDTVAAALGATRDGRACPRRRAAAPPPSSSPRPRRAALHLDAAARPAPRDFDPDVRDRLIAGAMMPAAWVVTGAELPRAGSATRCCALFESVDVILAPATPLPAPRIGQKTDGARRRRVPVRPNLGIFTQPISLHRPAGRRRAGLADGRARCRSACR